ncbi:hypothetical protein REA38_11590 [Serratia sp. MF2]|uniref:hypothetical protein n=1 Tax=Serratia sp. MF1(2023) TaxID=3059171 RepID=UPI0027F43A25|nr:hypothetical protein [Serratia sp. MF1(2023)]MDQ7104192.1 hypothetical protein [Serratia sp. MF1(2023)]
MKIGIDFDCTLTADVNLFSMFVRGALINGHEIKIVTYRHPDNKSGNIDAIAEALGIEIIFTDHEQKNSFCEKLGWIPDIWIDDKPERIPTPSKLVERLEEIEDEDAADFWHTAFEDE